MTVVRHESPSTLAIEPAQTAFTEPQLAALQQIGVQDAGPGDLEVFFHVCKRSGLDPFARQIHMVGRRARQPDGSYAMKYTIQTGIDGYRLIGRRAADRAGEGIAVDPPQWAHPEGGWRDVWSREWGLPLAARVTIRRDGDPFTAVAMFDEYKQTTRDGSLNSMWAQRPAGQIAKCAEALAWRTAFPQDLSGIYTDEEMGQAHSPAPAAPRSGLAEVIETTSGGEDHDPSPPEVHQAEGRAAPVSDEDGELLNTNSKLARAMYAGLRRAGIDKEGAKELYAEVTGREINSSADLTRAEASMVLGHLPPPPPDEEGEG